MVDSIVNFVRADRASGFTGSVHAVSIVRGSGFFLFTFISVVHV